MGWSRSDTWVERRSNGTLVRMKCDRGLSCSKCSHRHVVDLRRRPAPVELLESTHIQSVPALNPALHDLYRFSAQPTPSSPLPGAGLSAEDLTQDAVPEAQIYTLNPRIGTIQADPSYSDAHLAVDKLESIAFLTSPIMETFDLHVHQLLELGGDVSCVHGWNSGAGQEIRIRLRDPTRGWRTMEEVMDTMLHELTHNTYSEHDRHFYALWNALRHEYGRLRDVGYLGHGPINGVAGEKRDDASDTHTPELMMPFNSAACNVGPYLPTSVTNTPQPYTLVPDSSNERPRSQEADRPDLCPATSTSERSSSPSSSICNGDRSDASYNDLYDSLGTLADDDDDDDDDAIGNCSYFDIPRPARRAVPTNSFLG